MKPIVSIIMGSTSDLPVMEKAAKLLDEMHVPFEMNATSRCHCCKYHIACYRCPR